MNLEILSQEGQNLVLLTSLLILGCIICFLGYKLIHILLCLGGFITASLTAFLILGSFPNISIEWLILSTLFFGVVGACLSLFLLKAGMFLLGVLWGIILSIILYPIIDSPLSFFIFGLLGGISAIILEKPILIFSTASVGAILMFWSLIHFAKTLNLIENIPNSHHPYFNLISSLTWLGLTVLGSAIQFNLGHSK